MTIGRPIDEAVDAYVALFERDQRVWGAACWTVIQSEYDDDQLLSRLSDDYELLPAVALDELQELADRRSTAVVDAGREAMGWLIRSADAVGLFEVNGFAGSMTETLSALTGGASARVISMYWNDAVGRAILGYAVDGEVQIVDLVSEDYNTATAPELVEALSELSGEAAFEAKGMAIVERLSGVRLDDRLLTRQWPVVRFRMRQRPQPAVPATALIGDPAFAFALIQASPTVRREAQLRLIDEVLQHTGLTAEPVAVACVARFAMGETPERSDELFRLLHELELGYAIPERGQIDLAHPGWLRRQTGNMLFALCNPRDDLDLDPRRFQSWLSATFALGNQWTAARARYLAQLRRPG